jgi:hypothetical protein
VRKSVCPETAGQVCSKLNTTNLAPILPQWGRAARGRPERLRIRTDRACPWTISPRDGLRAASSSVQFYTDLSSEPALALAKIIGTRGAKIAQALAVCSAQIPAAFVRPGRFPCYAGGVPMDEFEFANKLNIQRFQNLLGTSLNESERQIIQKLLTEEKTKQGLSGSKPTSE